MTPFPRMVSFTLTHACSLRCEMCAQHSASGYVRNRLRSPGRALDLDDWLRLVDELALEGCRSLLLRGGEPFLFPGLIEVIGQARGAGIAVSIDTAGFQLEEQAEALARLGGREGAAGLHLTFSVDGPPEVHDQIRGVPGTFARLERGVQNLKEAMARLGTRLSLSLTCTLTPRSVAGLHLLPDTARRLGIPVVTLVPVYWVPDSVGREYEAVMARDLGCRAVTWRGVPQSVALPPGLLRSQLRRFREALGDLETYPYMPLEEEEYVTWFGDHGTPVGIPQCRNAEFLLDIQPDGGTNFCVDFCDYLIGNAREQSLSALWTGDPARAFRDRLARGPLPACSRCGARYMGEQGARQ